jgi:hypothetical protein
MRTLPSLLLLAAAVFSFSRPGSAQCLPAPPADVSCMSGTTVTSNTNITSGTYVHCTSSGSFSNVNINGGTLQVCGTLTLTNITFNSGVIHVAQYGTLTITGNVTLNNTCTIVNYGTLVINGNLQFQNSNNYVYNARTDARIAVGGSITFPVNAGQNSYLLNKGYITANSVTLGDGIVSFCMENGSYLGVGTFTSAMNNINNPITYGSTTGSALIRYSTAAHLGNNAGRSVTASSSINVCRAAGASLSGTGTWGAATLSTGCAERVQPAQTGMVVTCYTLPVEWLDFGGYTGPDGIELLWSTASETNNAYFDIQRAGPDGAFTSIGRVEGAGNSSQINRYAFTWTEPAEGDNYFRIRQVDFNGDYDYSGTIYIRNAPKSQIDYSISPLFNEQISVNVREPEAVLFLVLYNEMGQILLRSPLQEGDNFIDAQQLAAGSYVAAICNREGEILSRNLMLKAQ